MCLQYLPDTNVSASLHMQQARLILVLLHFPETRLHTPSQIPREKDGGERGRERGREGGRREREKGGRDRDRKRRKRHRGKEREKEMIPYCISAKFTENGRHSIKVM